MELSVVIPTYRETDRLNVTLKEILPYLEDRFKKFEIIVVDDPDLQGHYTQLALPFAADSRIKFLAQPRKRGKGAAVKRGCLESRGQIILFMDADHSTPIQEFDRFRPYFKDECMVSGVRTFQENESKWRRILGLLTQLFLHLFLFKKAVVDSQCGFKAFSYGVVQKVFPLLKVNGGMIDAEIFYLMHKFDLPSYFEPVHWHNKDGSRINILVCLYNDPLEIFKILLYDLFGGYRLEPRALPRST